MAEPRKTLAEIEREVMSDPARRKEVERHKAAMRAAMRLAEIREKAGTTQTELARLLGVTQSRISSLERAEDVKLSTLIRYVEALGGELVVNAKFGHKTVPLSIDRA